MGSSRSKRAQILITGKQGRFYQAVAEAMAQRSGFCIVALPAGSRLFEVVRTHPLEAVILPLQSKEEIEPARWILHQNRSLPLVAVLPRKDLQLREQLLQEGVWQVVEVPGLKASEIRRKLGQHLQNLHSKIPGSSYSGRQIASDLHAIRSALTAILGNAEMALKNASRSGPQKKHLMEIPRGVAEIEKILRRLDRALKPLAPPTEART